ncbi:MAG: CRISPR-associated protein Cas4 [Bacteroidetes bacterium]|nr:CRISPR-associated protein Cas4 [Bacteroidota bacterium]MBU1721142.1 CRISPR-associated protein Cas4 [Bacteroidota bacterium]
MQITGTHINYFFTCHRKLWLFANGINMEHTSDLVSSGKLIHESTYQQRSERFKEVELGPVRIDFYDTANRVIHEVKKSDKLENSHKWQVRYYIWLMEQAGVEGVTGLLEYPKLRHTEEVFLTEPDREELRFIISEAEKLIHSDNCPEAIKMQICKNCAYNDFCWCGEADDGAA